MGLEGVAAFLSQWHWNRFLEEQQGLVPLDVQAGGSDWRRKNPLQLLRENVYNVKMTVGYC